MSKLDSLEDSLSRVVTYEDFARLSQLLNGRTAQYVFETLFPLAIQAGPGSGIASRLLIDIQPGCPSDLPALLNQIHAASLDASNREVPFYLVSQFGQRAVLREASEFLAKLPGDGPRSKVDAVAYWAAMPASNLCKPFQRWEDELCAMDVSAIRARVIEELTMLSEPSRQVEYEQALRNHAGVAHHELLVGYPELFQLKAPDFIAAFSEQQLSDLAHLYGLFMELNGRDFTTVGDMLKNPMWRRIVHLAQELRRSLDDGPNKSRGRTRGQ